MSQVKTAPSDHELSNQYVALRKNYSRELYDRILSRCSKGTGRNLLDLATGPGIVVFDLENEFRDLHGIDFSAARIEEAKREAKRRNQVRAKFEVADAAAIPFAPERFDLVTIAQGFQYLPQPASGREIFRILRKDGVVAIFWKYPSPLSVLSQIANEAIEMTNSEQGARLPLRADMQPKLESHHLPQQLTGEGFKDVEFHKFSGNYEYTTDEWIKSVVWAVGAGNRSISNSVMQSLTAHLDRCLRTKQFELRLMEPFDHFLWTARK